MEGIDSVMIRPTIDAFGTKHWFNEQYKKHRLDGPAVIWFDGEQEYWVNGKIPLNILDLIITDSPMVFDAELVPSIRYARKTMRAYRFSDPDELALAILYYS